jgi:hypothetical protein
MRIALTIGAMTMLLASPALSATDGAPAPRTGGDEIVCKSTGSAETFIGKRRICMTQREWRELMTNDREQTEDLQLRSLATPPKT